MEVVRRELNSKSLSPAMRKGGLGKTYKESHRLADCLGADHDLALLHDKIIQYRPSGGAAAEALVHRLALGGHMRDLMSYVICQAWPTYVLRSCG
jgi:hypothetical protein